MVILGILLIAVAAAAGADVVVENTSKVSGTFFQQHVSGWSLGGVFLAGAVTALVFAFGLYLLLRGLNHKRRKAVERRHERKNAKAEQQALAADRERLAKELEQERAARAAAEAHTPTSAPEGGSHSV